MPCDSVDVPTAGLGIFTLNIHLIQLDVLGFDVIAVNLGSKLKWNLFCRFVHSYPVG